MERNGNQPRTLLILRYPNWITLELIGAIKAAELAVADVQRRNL